MKKTCRNQNCIVSLYTTNQNNMKNQIKVTDWSKQEYTCTIEKNKNIQIDCFYTNSHSPKQTSVKFEIGDEAEYNSYNLRYTGKIISITEKTVSIKNAFNEVSRLKIADFCWRNWDFNAEKVKQYNTEESYCI